MKYSRYKFKFYLNASHAIYLNGALGQNHAHTWEIILDTVKSREDFVQFDKIEQVVEEYLEQFQDSNLNEIKPFDVSNPTLENLTIYFKNHLVKLLWDRGWLLTKIEVGETPARSYIIELDDEYDQLYSNSSTSGNEEINTAVENKLALVLGS